MNEPQAATRAILDCRHCGGAITSEHHSKLEFCCHGCEAAYGLVSGLGLDGYYRRRQLDPAARSLKPDPDASPVEYESYVRELPDGAFELNLMIDGMQCAACVWLIEQVLMRQDGVTSARVNMTTRRLVLKWRGASDDAVSMISPIHALGYRLMPYDPALLGLESEAREKELLRAMAIAGFATANVMLISVALWAGYFQGMGPATRGMMHWLSALIALPAVAYAGMPFYRSALGALTSGRVNMDVPISLAVLLASAMSLYETMTGGEHAYFDSAVTLLFFLLVGRYLDRRARGRARTAAEQLIGLAAHAVTVIDAAGKRSVRPPSEVKAGMTVLASAGESIAVDGVVETGGGDIDTSLITGESVPLAVAVGDQVFAGTINLTAPLRITVSAAGEETVLADIVRLMEAAERGRANHVALADRVARLYAPVVHVLALAAFLGWWGVGGADWQEALLIAVSVLIITCPCALALAVPVVQVVAAGRLMRRGILVKSPTALERLAAVDRVVFDKTGTLTEGHPQWEDDGTINRETLTEAASMAANSRHPLARALVAANSDAATAEGVREIPGCGLERMTPDGPVRLGNRNWCGIEDGKDGLHSDGPELWLSRPEREGVRFSFRDAPRRDAADVISALKASTIGVSILSGDRAEAVAPLAEALAINDWQAACSPQDKARRLGDMAGLAQTSGGGVMMVGDGLNDAPALASATVSMSPSTAADISQTVADVVFQGDRLDPVREVLTTARRADVLVRQNFAIALLYNGITVPMALAGWVTPLIAAIAMSASSLMVIINALRLSRGGT